MIPVSAGAEEVLHENLVESFPTQPSGTDRIGVNFQCFDAGCIIRTVGAE